jgi:rod shape-determining protein MreD
MRLSLTFAAFGSSIAQSSVVHLVTVGAAAPDLPLIVTALLALRRGPEVACVVGFAAGFLQDLAGGGLVGVQALTKALAGFGLGLTVGRLWVASPFVQVGGLVLLTVAEGLLRYALLRVFHFPAALPDLLVGVILPQACYNGAVAAACLLVIEATEAVRVHVRWR